ncbi:hypothetical protein ACHQM5_024660 [Ranunculus cassubicifolius]
MATTAAAVSASAWGKPGGWAQDLEKQEQEESLQQQPLSDFPSLSAAAVTKTKTKKKKPQTVSLSEFTTGANKGFLTTDVDLSILPTGPRERSADEILGERSGGFKSYSSSRHSNEEDRWGSSFNNNNNNKDRDRGFNREPSRADETDDWGAAKRSAPTRGFSSSRGNGSGFFDSQSSKADESDNWLANKKSFVPSERRSGGGFESTADSKREEGRPRLVLQPRSLPVTITVNNGDQPPSVTKTNPFGAARPREQVLADWKKIDEQLESNLKLDSERSWRKTDSPAPREEEEKPDKQGGDVELN